MNGKQIRLNRILENKKAVIIPLDHGVSEGPAVGLEQMNKTVPRIEEGKASAIIVHKGIIKSLERVPNCGLIMHLSGSTDLAPDPNNKVLVSSVDEAIRWGADAVSVHINIGGSSSEPDMLQLLGKVSEECEEKQMPLLAMMYPRGPNIQKLDSKTVGLVARSAAELGADIVKTPYTGCVGSFKKVVEGCPVPVVVPGGPKFDDPKKVLEIAKGAIDAGAIGISIGRNVFEYSNPTAMVKALRSIVLDNKDVEYALEILKR